MPNFSTSSLISGAKNLLPERLRNPANWMDYASIPAYAGKAFKEQFIGTAGKKNLMQGILPATGLSGLSLMSDRIDGPSESHTGRTLGLGALGFMAPSVARASNAAKNISKTFYGLSNNMRDAGILMEPASRTTKRWEYLGAARDAGPLNYIKSMFSSQGRQGLKKFLAPSNTVQVQKMTNAEGSLPTTGLPMATKLFGKTTFDAGGIINPNIGRMVQTGIAGKKLKELGFNRLIGETAPTRKLGPELYRALDSRYKEVLNKTHLPEATIILGGRKFNDLSEVERLALMPTSNSVFPVAVNAGSTPLNITRGASKLIPYTESDLKNFVAEGREVPTLYDPWSAWKGMSREHKGWLKGQGVQNSHNYANLIEIVDMFTKHVKQTAKQNPDRFLQPGFSLPSLRNIFTSSVAKPFDIKL